MVPTAFADDIACELAAIETILLTHLVGFVLFCSVEHTGTLRSELFIFLAYLTDSQ